MNVSIKPEGLTVEREIPPLAYRIEDAATALGVGRTLIYKMISEGLLTRVKIGKRSLIAVSELDAFLARGGSK
jgi:excisionase family DNA binding protein